MLSSVFLKDKCLTNSFFKAKKYDYSYRTYCRRRISTKTEYTAALIISQYCAAKEKDYRDISLPDFERTVKTADNIYRYEKTEETRKIETAVTVINAETGEETENIITAVRKLKTVDF